MKMQVVNRLPPIFAGVADDAETALPQTLLPHDAADSTKNVVAEPKFANFGPIDARYVRLGDN
jgi:hypothetical protein